MQRINHLPHIPMDSQTTLRTLPLYFIIMSQLKCWKHYETQLVITEDVIMKNNGKVRDIGSLACKINDLFGGVRQVKVFMTKGQMKGRTDTQLSFNAAALAKVKGTIT